MNELYMMAKVLEITATRI